MIKCGGKSGKAKMFFPHNTKRYIYLKQKKKKYQKNIIPRVKHGGVEYHALRLLFFRWNWGFNQGGVNNN